MPTPLQSDPSGFDRYRTSPRPEQEGETVLSSHEFEVELDRVLRPLRRTHVRASLFALKIRGLSDPVWHEVAGGALGRFGFVGALPDGSAGALYVGPCRPGDIGDMMCRIRSHARKIVTDTLGWFDQDLIQVEVIAVHGWSDELDDPGALVESLIQHSRS